MSYSFKYFSSSSKTELESFLAEFKPYLAHMEITQGRDAIEAHTDEEGNEVPAQEAVGDSSLYYVGTVYDDNAGLVIPSGITEIENTCGCSVCGEWFDELL